MMMETMRRDELANGKPATERNVSNLLDDLMEDYEQGDSWDEG